MSEEKRYCGHCHLPHHPGSDHYLRPCEAFQELTAMTEKKPPCHYTDACSEGFDEKEAALKAQLEAAKTKDEKLFNHYCEVKSQLEQARAGEKTLWQSRAEVMKDLDRIHKDNVFLHSEKAGLNAQLEQARQSNEQLREALKFYADPKKWEEFTVESGEIFGAQDGDFCMAFESEDNEPWTQAQWALEDFPPLPASRMKRLEDVASAARHLFHELNCPEDEVKTGGLANFDALEKAVQALDAEAPTGSTEEKEKRE